MLPRLVDSLEELLRRQVQDVGKDGDGSLDILNVWAKHLDVVVSDGDGQGMAVSVEEGAPPSWEGALLLVGVRCSGSQLNVRRHLVPVEVLGDESPSDNDYGSQEEQATRLEVARGPVACHGRSLTHREPAQEGAGPIEQLEQR